MPRRKEIQNVVGTELYNIQVNPENFDFSPTTPFVKWAAVAVSDFDMVPDKSTAAWEAFKVIDNLYWEKQGKFFTRKQ